MFYQLDEPGWFSIPTSGGFPPLWGVSSFNDLGLSTVEASNILFSGDVMAFGHVFRPVRSASKVCVGVVGVPLWVPLKIRASSSGGWSASTTLFRPSATSAAGRSLQGHGCNFHVFQGCLCKCWDVVNHQRYIYMKYNPGFLKKK
jgi:hypothetical protein